MVQSNHYIVHSNTASKEPCQLSTWIWILFVTGYGLGRLPLTIICNVHLENLVPPLPLCALTLQPTTLRIQPPFPILSFPSPYANAVEPISFRITCSLVYSSCLILFPGSMSRPNDLQVLDCAMTWPAACPRMAGMIQRFE